MTIEDFGLHSDYHFESHLLGNGLYTSINLKNDDSKKTMNDIAS